MVVATAVKLPAVLGPVLILTVKAVAVAAVTVPTAPLLNRTVLLAGVVASKPKPLMVSVAALAARLLVLLVTTGLTVATCTAEPLLRLLLVTIAVNPPIVVGFVPNVTVIEVAVAAVTVPTAPLLKTTVLLAAVGSKPKPAITTVAALAAKLATLRVTSGVTEATCTAEPLVRLLVVTTAVKLPADVGLVVSETVSKVAVAAVTVPTAPLLNVTVLWLAVESKPNPAIVIELALAARFVVAEVTTGVTAAT